MRWSKFEIGGLSFGWKMRSDLPQVSQCAIPTLSPSLISFEQIELIKRVDKTERIHRATEHQIFSGFSSIFALLCTCPCIPLSKSYHALGYTRCMCQSRNQSPRKGQIGGFDVPQVWPVVKRNTPSQLPQPSHYPRTILRLLEYSFGQIVLMKICDRTDGTKGQNETKALVCQPKHTSNFSVDILLDL